MKAVYSSQKNEGKSVIIKRYLVLILLLSASSSVLGTELLYNPDLIDQSENTIALSVARSGDTDGYAKARIASDININLI
ncbi:MAG: hypothetical protein ACI9OI_002133 [Chitinophagales bacterium]|jgi:hypothetical protein